ncbi:hypothetical protein ACFHWS_22425 [Micromonospora sp. LOL_013]|uniref:MFS transporter n=1 Tax=Micromonospora sp. LOL_013 TaxID=3345414 RepID=UPI003A85BC3B
MLLSLRSSTPGMLSVASTRSKERRLDGLDEHRRFLKACRDRDLDAAEAVFRTTRLLPSTRCWPCWNTSRPTDVPAVPAAAGVPPLLDLVPVRRILHPGMPVNAVVSILLCLYQSYAVLTVGQLLTGFASGPVALCGQALMDDLTHSDPKARDRGYSMLQAFVSMGAASALVLGAFAGLDVVAVALTLVLLGTCLGALMPLSVAISVTGTRSCGRPQPPPKGSSVPANASLGVTRCLPC